MTYTTILTETRGRVGLVTLNRPNAMNALNPTILRELIAMAKAGNVVFGYEFIDLGDPSPPGGPPSDAVRATALTRFESVAVPPAPSLIEPEPVLADAAAAVGHVSTVESADGRPSAG